MAGAAAVAAGTRQLVLTRFPPPVSAAAATADAAAAAAAALSAAASAAAAAAAAAGSSGEAAGTGTGVHAEEGSAAALHVVAAYDMQRLALDRRDAEGVAHDGMEGFGRVAEEGQNLALAEGLAGVSGPGVEWDALGALVPTPEAGRAPADGSGSANGPAGEHARLSWDEQHAAPAAQQGADDTSAQQLPRAARERGPGGRGRGAQAGDEAGLDGDGWAELVAGAQLARGGPAQRGPGGAAGANAAGEVADASGEVVVQEWRRGREAAPLSDEEEDAFWNDDGAGRSAAHDREDGRAAGGPGAARESGSLGSSGGGAAAELAGGGGGEAAAPMDWRGADAAAVGRGGGGAVLNGSAASRPGSIGSCEPELADSVHHATADASAQ
jgi:hypothetical protein